MKDNKSFILVAVVFVFCFLLSCLSGILYYYYNLDEEIPTFDYTSSTSTSTSTSTSSTVQLSTPQLYLDVSPITSSKSISFSIKGTGLNTDDVFNISLKTGSTNVQLSSSTTTKPIVQTIITASSPFVPGNYILSVTNGILTTNYSFKIDTINIAITNATIKTNRTIEFSLSNSTGMFNDDEITINFNQGATNIKSIVQNFTNTPITITLTSDLLSGTSYSINIIPSKNRQLIGFTSTLIAPTLSITVTDIRNNSVNVNFAAYSGITQSDILSCSFKPTSGGSAISAGNIIFNTGATITISIPSPSFLLQNTTYTLVLTSTTNNFVFESSTFTTPNLGTLSITTGSSVTGTSIPITLTGSSGISNDQLSFTLKQQGSSTTIPTTSSGSSGTYTLTVTSTDPTNPVVLTQDTDYQIIMSVRGFVSSFDFKTPNLGTLLLSNLRRSSIAFDVQNSDITFISSRNPIYVQYIIEQTSTSYKRIQGNNISTPSGSIGSTINFHDLTFPTLDSLNLETNASYNFYIKFRDFLSSPLTINVPNIGTLSLTPTQVLTSSSIPILINNSGFDVNYLVFFLKEKNSGDQIQVNYAVNGPQNDQSLNGQYTLTSAYPTNPLVLTQDTDYQIIMSVRGFVSSPFDFKTPNLGTLNNITLINLNQIRFEIGNSTVPGTPAVTTEIIDNSGSSIYSYTTPGVSSINGSYNLMLSGGRLFRLNSSYNIKTTCNGFISENKITIPDINSDFKLNINSGTYSGKSGYSYSRDKTSYDILTTNIQNPGTLVNISVTVVVVGGGGGGCGGTLSTGLGGGGGGGGGGEVRKSTVILKPSPIKYNINIGNGGAGSIGAVSLVNQIGGSVGGSSSITNNDNPVLRINANGGGGGVSSVGGGDGVSRVVDGGGNSGSSPTQYGGGGGGGSNSNADRMNGGDGDADLNGMGAGGGGGANIVSTTTGGVGGSNNSGGRGAGLYNNIPEYNGSNGNITGCGGGGGGGGSGSGRNTGGDGGAGADGTVILIF